MSASVLENRSNDAQRQVDPGDAMTNLGTYLEKVLSKISK